MRKNVKIICAVLVMLCLLSASALAAASVRYVGGAEKFVFLPGSEYSDSDLFENFKGVMPGDVIEQKITVKNNSDKKVRIYMRAEPVDEVDADFLNQLHLTVKSGDTQIFEAQAGEQDGLTTNKLLGTFKQNGSVELTATLSVPIELGNEYMDEKGTVPWTFIVEEITEDDTPETGDWFQMGAWCAAALAIAAAIVILVVFQRKKKEA